MKIRDGSGGQERAIMEEPTLRKTYLGVEVYRTDPDLIKGLASNSVIKDDKVLSKCGLLDSRNELWKRNTKTGQKHPNP